MYIRREKMGFTYGLNVKIEIGIAEFSKIIKDQKAELSLEKYYWFNFMGSIFFLETYKVNSIDGEETVKHYLSVNGFQHKSGESSGFGFLQQEIDDAKYFLSRVLSNSNFESYIQLSKLEIGVTQQESPFMD